MKRTSINKNRVSCKFCKKRNELTIYGTFCNRECSEGYIAQVLEKKRLSDEKKHKKALEWQNEAQKDWKKFKPKAKKEHRSLQSEVVLTKKSFQKWIKHRDKLNGINYCISCEKTFLPNEKYDGGHFWKAENYSMVIFNPDNVHSQCVYCNRELAANLLEYLPRLQKKIGIERLNRLNELAQLHKDYKYPRQWLIDYREICEDLVRKNESNPKLLIEKLKEIGLN